MELNPGLSEVVFGLRAEVEALKTRLNKIERGQEVAVSAAYWQAVERERDSREKSGVSCSDLVEKNGTLSQESQGSTRRSHDSAKIRMQVGSQV